MHSRPAHQATGLGAHMRLPSARLVSMVSYGHERAELPLLWRLCLTWVELGYPVTVLDAGTRESESNPGLEQMLEFPFGQPPGLQDENAWRVVPAALGFKALAMAGKSLSDIESRLASLCPEDGVVVAYAGAETLLSLLHGFEMEPVLVASSAPDSLLAGYLALKRLLSVSGIDPLVIDQSATTSNLRTSPARTLADCTKNYLNYHLNVIQLQCAADDAPPAPDLQRLALRVLESAHAMTNRWSALAHNGTKMGTGQFSRSH